MQSHDIAPMCPYIYGMSTFHLIDVSCLDQAHGTYVDNIVRWKFLVIYYHYNENCAYILPPPLPTDPTNYKQITDYECYVIQSLLSLSVDSLAAARDLPSATRTADLLWFETTDFGQLLEFGDWFRSLTRERNAAASAAFFRADVLDYSRDHCVFWHRHRTRIILKLFSIAQIRNQ